MNVARKTSVLLIAIAMLFSCTMTVFASEVNVGPETTVDVEISETEALLQAANSSYTIYLCGINDEDGEDRTSWQIEAALRLANISNSAIYYKNAHTATQLGQYLKYSNLFMIHTHGAATLLRSVDSSGNVSYLTYSTINNWDSSVLDEVDVAFLGACSTGEGGSSGTNLVNLVYNKGAAVSIGYTTTVATKWNRRFLEAFGSAMGCGYSVTEALAYADSYVFYWYSSTGNTNNRLTRGNTSLRLTSVKSDAGLFSADTSISESNMLGSSQALEDGQKVYFNNSGEISGWFDFSLVNNSSDAGYVYVQSNEEINLYTKATECLNAICEDANRYTAYEEYYAEDTGLTTYTFLYQIDGHNTEDVIYVMMNDQGEVVSCGWPHKGEFDDVDLSNVNWDATYDALDSSLAAEGIFEYSIVDERLVLEDDTVYLRCFVEYPVDEYMCGADYLISLK